MNIRQYIIKGLFFIAPFCLNSCVEVEVISDDIYIPGLGGTNEVANELDFWLYDNFTEPYNIEVVYRWDASQMHNSLSAKLVPIEYNAVRPMMAAMRDVWFEPFNIAAGEDFMKEMAPKKVVLVGSPEFQNGTVKLGQAEGGKKILLLNANNFDATNEDEIKSALHTVVHEFAHILHQTIMFDKNFQAISAGHYNSTGWQEVSAKDAYQLGFVSNYAMSGKDEDFVEIISRILVYGYDWYNKTVVAEAEKSDKTDAASALQRKLTIVEDYMKNVWDIRLLDNTVTGEKGLESYMQQALMKVISNPPTE